MDMHFSDALGKDTPNSAEAEGPAPATDESTPAKPTAPAAPASTPTLAPTPTPSLRSDCMPLAFAHVGAELRVCKVMGPRATQQYVKSLGFVEDASVEVISFSPGGVIVRIMGSTFGVGSELARRIYVH